MAEVWVVKRSEIVNLPSLAEVKELSEQQSVKPKGIDNKVRLSVKGTPPLAKVGYGKQKNKRGLHPSGLYEKPVHNIKELQGLGPKKNAKK
jgi:ribosomal protein L32E